MMLVHDYVLRTERLGQKLHHSNSMMRTRKGNLTCHLHFLFFLKTL